MIIEVEHLTKDYGTVVAVRDVSFSVKQGEIVGFLGPNGAGKSTTLRILAGFLGATNGRVKINGFDIFEQSLQARRSLGYMPEAAPLYPEMRVGEYLRFRAALKKVPRRERRAAVERSMGQAAVADMVDTLIGHLSKGYRQRVALADALVSNPPLLILDEPTAGLDPNQIREVRRLIREQAESRTILLSTHILSEVETTCDRALVIDRGRLVAEGTLDELRRRRAGRAARFVVSGDGSRAHELVTGVSGVKRVRAQPHDPALTRLIVKYDAESDDLGAAIERTVSALVGAGLGVREAAPEKATLEDVFAALTRAEADLTVDSEGSEETS
jgi:ABC-2 type transport system ATP-binding protein